MNHHIYLCIRTCSKEERSSILLIGIEDCFYAELYERCEHHSEINQIQSHSNGLATTKLCNKHSKGIGTTSE